MNDDINKQFYRYLSAYILVALSGCLGNVVDGIIVGNLISEDGVSAINLSKPINQFIFTLHLLINAGAGMLVGYALGRGDTAMARRYFTRALTLSTGLGVVLAVVAGLLLPDQTAHLLCSNPFFSKKEKVGNRLSAGGVNNSCRTGNMTEQETGKCETETMQQRKPESLSPR